MFFLSAELISYKINSSYVFSCWYGNTLKIPYVYYPWSNRGGGYSGGSLSGVFFSDGGARSSDSRNSTRFVLLA